MNVMPGVVPVTPVPLTVATDGSYALEPPRSEAGWADASEVD